MVEASDGQRRLIDILEYWHKIEFFIPFDLSQVTDVEEVWRLRWIKPTHLKTWQASDFRKFVIPPKLKISGFRLYIGLLDKSEIADVCRRVLPGQESDDEDEQRGALEGRTCFARMLLNARGEPLFDPVSVSTVPWALGRATSQGLDSLQLSAFEAAKLDLVDRLDDFRRQRAPATSSDPMEPVEPDNPPAMPLTGAEIEALSELFTEWSGFTPQAGQPLLLEVLTAKKEAKEKSAADDDDDGEAEPAVDILNSFYLEDIESAIQALRKEAVPLLGAYLGPLASDRRIDVYTDAGRAALLRLLHPSRRNRGRWLSQAAHSMSLMQQFAINAGLDRLRDGGLFAVNGPPGTGKTTLLRELFADNIVRRAGVLARLRTSGAAFLPKEQVHFQNGRQTWISPLKPELTGFEMVVASSNNAAVENISSDLPKLTSLGDEWKHIDYLRSVAYRIAAEDEEGYFHPSKEIAPWGLISCALGKSANRQRFVSKFYQDNWNTEVEPDPRCQNIRQWIAGYAGPTFAQAASAYRALESEVEEANAALSRYADIWQRNQGVDRERFCEAEEAALASARTAAARAARDSAEAGEALRRLLERQAGLREDERLLDRQAPGLLARWVMRAAWRRHREERSHNAGEQRAVLHRVADARRALEQCVESLERHDAGVNEALADLEARRREWDGQQRQLAEWRERYSLELPATELELELDRFQIAGLWHDRELARMRSALFASALALHEAWLAEVGKKDGGFGGNLFAVSQLLTNKRLDNAAQVPMIWQSLFMVVPVVSTTFASLARQFKGMGAASIGWLFIDEAGQAVPQAAVGGLWRARRAVVVGDPLQIEPVFTVPRALIRGLSAQLRATAGEAYAPDKVSVQRLADDANIFGALVPQPGGEGLWIGSPLRVHRRCADPMFSLSNAIAYEGKMVIEPARRDPEKLVIPMGQSAWIDIAGPVAFKQVVPQQTEFIAELIVTLYRKGGALPALYVISPFKAVRDALRKRIQEIDWRGQGPKKSVLKKWCKQSVGTVHTFQGKEQAMVLMVLGADKEHAGSALWASSKPNLLNVALTRAQQYFYIVGASEVWRGMDYFAAAHSKLPLVGPGEFLAGVGDVLNS